MSRKRLSRGGASLARAVSVDVLVHKIGHAVRVEVLVDGVDGAYPVRDEVTGGHLTMPRRRTSIVPSALMSSWSRSCVPSASTSYSEGSEQRSELARGGPRAPSAVSPRV